jgi:hypothetical protein
MNISRNKKRTWNEVTPVFQNKVALRFDFIKRITSSAKTWLRHCYSNIHRYVLIMKERWSTSYKLTLKSQRKRYLRDLGVFGKIILKLASKSRGFIIWRPLKLGFFLCSPSCAAVLWQNSELTLFVRFDVPTEDTMKNVVFWDVTPYRPVEVNQYFQGTYYCLHLQVSKYKRNK